jgi:hypothetical protein
MVPDIDGEVDKALGVAIREILFDFQKDLAPEVGTSRENELQGIDWPARQPPDIRVRAPPLPSLITGQKSHKQTSGVEKWGNGHMLSEELENVITHGCRPYGLSPHR